MSTPGQPVREGRLAGRVAFVTGAASAAPVVDGARGLGARVSYHRADVSDEAAVRSAAAAATDAHGRVDILVNNAGIFTQSLLEDMSVADWDRALAVNLRGISRLGGDDEVDALAGGAKSLNCMLLTPRALYAVCSYDPSSYEEPDYYPLLYRATKDTVVVASTGWTDSAGWTTLDNGQMLVVDRETLGTRVVAVATPLTAIAASR